MKLNPPAPLMNKSLLTAEEVASITGLSLETLAQCLSQRRGLPYLKIGRTVRYDLADVQAYLEGCRVSVSAPQGRRQK
jgi:excisionase family DNA binding protein